MPDKMKTLEEILWDLFIDSERMDRSSDIIAQATSEILELHKQELALKCKGIEEVIKNPPYKNEHYQWEIIYGSDKLATKLTEWIVK